MRSPPHSNAHLLFSFLLHLFTLPILNADVGTAAYYGRPYLPTVCFGSDSSQFPANNLIAAAGEGLWDNGASCGRQYLVRCLSSETAGGCSGRGPMIQVTVVDEADALASMPSVNRTTLVLSRTAFGMIADISVAMKINIEFAEV
ncbi:EG45-like domain containing protein [Asparagus officinalis]|uniref:EG45-like domain containing protein n=1 Tax=Asparagus officinalis TaxID=4686 RepID=UPI00098E15CB|nr:EG45-like domain containing protein [Asparagus officinalis]